VSVTPSFTGQEAVILHRTGETTERLARQLRLLGLTVACQWSPLGVGKVPGGFVFFDADAGHAGLLPWEPGSTPVPLVALLGSEAPGRIAFALDLGAHALIAKPVLASAVYPALVMASRAHAEARRIAERIARLEERLRLRPLVHQALSVVMAGWNLDEEAAHRHLRQEAMRRGLTVEQVAAGILAGQPRARGMR
jgi:AmiR/NasT family two-component response regulator